MLLQQLLQEMYEIPVKQELDEVCPHSDNLFSCTNETLKPYNCPTCPYTTHLKVIFATHCHTSGKLSPIVTLTNYTCKKCTFETHSFLVFARHKIKKCNKPKTKSKTIKCQQCDHCTHQTKRSFDMKIHKLMHHTAAEIQNWYQCEHCPYKTLVRQYYQVHRWKRHLNTSPVVSCSKCSYQTHQKADMRAHLKFIHSIGKCETFACDFCEFVTNRKHTMIRHKKVKHPNPDDNSVLKCEHCGFQTKYVYTLKCHIERKHVGNLPWFECEQCSYKAQVKEYLKKHIRNVHTKDVKIVWFKCEFCEYRSKRKYTMRIHARRHSKEAVK